MRDRPPAPTRVGRPLSHVYHERRVFELREMGHVTVTSESVDDALGRARTALAVLAWEGASTADEMERGSR